jgi:hypothetical protein
MTENQATDENNIERCTADSKFSVIPNEISQHPTMSMGATVVLVYLRSCKESWVVKPKNVWKAKNISRDRVYAAFDELIELGYMDRVVTRQGNLKSSVRYKVSYLKKYLRRPEPRYTEAGGPETQDALIKTICLKEDPNKKIKEDNVFPTRARENPKPKKDIVLSPEAMEKPKAKALDPERFRRKLDTEQRELHDKLVAFNPEWGESLSSDFVCLLFNDKKPYTVKQIENAFAVYEQDATAARARNRSIRSLSAYLRDALKKGRRPECADFEFNKSHAEFVQKRRPGIKIMKKYAKVMIGKSQHEVDFDLPKAEFIRQLEKLLQLLQDMR